jgi:hypothetical protein
MDEDVKEWTVDDHLRHRQSQGTRPLKDAETEQERDDRLATENTVRVAPEMIGTETWIKRRQEARR